MKTLLWFLAWIESGMSLWFLFHNDTQMAIWSLIASFYLYYAATRPTLFDDARIVGIERRRRSK